MGDIYVEEWASPLNKIIAVRSKVYARDSIPRLALSYPGDNVVKNVCRTTMKLTNRWLKFSCT
jgi:hypothetical protein